MSLTVELSLYDLDEVYTMYFSTDTKLFFTQTQKLKQCHQLEKYKKILNVKCLNKAKIKY